MSLEIVLLGPPGTGKGTHASHLITKYLIPHISTGDMLRDNLHHQTELGVEAKKFMDQGNLAPDSLVTRMVKNRLSQKDAVNGFLLDGYPRTVDQAKSLNQVLLEIGRKLQIVLYIESNEELIIKRLTDRRICSVCNKIYNVKTFPTKVEGKCDDCHGEVMQREDDTKETVLKRLDVYHEQTAELIDFYDKVGLLRRIDGDAPVQKTQDQINKHLKSLLV